MQINVPKRRKTSDSLGGLHVDDWENGGIGMDILYLISRHLQRPDWGPAELKKRSQCNESSFRIAARPQDLQDQRWSSEDWQHYSEDLRNGSLYLFRVG